MALLRPCRRIFRGLCGLSASCQIEYIRGVVSIARAQGYVTLAQESAYPSSNFEKFDSTSSNENFSRRSQVPRLKADVRRRLVSLCRCATSEKKMSADLLELLERSAGGKIALDESVGLALLRNCGDMFPFLKIDDRINLTNLVWETVSERSSELSLAHYNALLRVYVANRQSIDPRKFLNGMTVKADETTYRLLLRSAGQNGDVECAAYVFSMIKDAGLALDEDIFNSVIEAHANNGDMKSALSAVRMMREEGLEPNTETQARIASGYAALGDIENTLKILKDNSLGVRQIMEIVKRASCAGIGKHIPALLSYLPGDVNEKDSLLFDTIKNLVNNGYPEDALEMISCLIKVNETDEKHPVYEAFLRTVVHANVPAPTVLKFAERISTEMKYSLALADVGKAALQTGNGDLAMAVFEAMHDKSIPVRSHYYWPLLIQSSKTHGEAEVFRILKHMLCLNVPVDHGTLLKDVFPFINTVDPLIALRKLNDIGLEISKIFTSLICYLLYQGRLREALTLCFKIRAPIDFSLVTRPLVQAYKCNRNVLDAAKLYKFAPPKKHYPDEFLLFLFGNNPRPKDIPALNDFRRVFRHLGIPLLSFPEDVKQQDNELGLDDEVKLVDPFNSSRPARIAHPTEMNVEELECHLIELRAKGMNDRGVMRRLMQVHCRELNIDRVEEIKKEFEENGYPWTPGMYSSLLQLYSQKGRAMDALNLYRHLQKNYSTFKIDDFKVLLLATALVKSNNISEAIHLLETNRSSGGKRITQDCWRLLNAVVYSPNSELTSSILDILVNSGFCVKDNTLLGPLVREHLLKNDLEAAVDTFTKCAERYKHVPLRQELINALVTSMKDDEFTRNRSMKLLEAVQRVCLVVHGIHEANVDLAIALARNGMVDDLHRFFKNHRVADGLLIKNLRLLPEETKVPVLKTILDVTTEESGLDRSLLYECILALCNRSGDCQLAIETRRRLLADTDATESKEFRKQFNSLLEKHKVPLPEDFVKKLEESS